MPGFFVEEPISPGCRRSIYIVIAGLDPAIHPLLEKRFED
jgi:hypothetical protein